MDGEESRPLINHSLCHTHCHPVRFQHVLAPFLHDLKLTVKDGHAWSPLGLQLAANHFSFPFLLQEPLLKMKGVLGLPLCDLQLPVAVLLHLGHCYCALKKKKETKLVRYKSGLQSPSKSKWSTYHERHAYSLS